MDLVSSSSVLKHRDLGKQKKVSFMAAVRVPEQRRAQVKGKTIGDDKVDRSRVAQSVPVPGRTIAAFRARRQAFYSYFFLYLEFDSFYTIYQSNSLRN